MSYVNSPDIKFLTFDGTTVSLATARSAGAIDVSLMFFSGTSVLVSDGWAQSESGGSFDGPSSLGLSYSTRKINSRFASLRDDYLFGLLAGTSLEVSLSSSTALEKVPFEVSLGYGVAGLSSATTRFSAQYHTVGLGQVRLRQSIAYQVYVAKVEYTRMAVGYEVRNYDLVTLALPAYVGVLGQSSVNANLSHFMNGLIDQYLRIQVSSKVGRLVSSHLGFGAEYGYYRMSDPVTTWAGFNYHIKDFDPVAVSLSFSELATAQKVDFEFSYSYTYEARPYFSMAFGRDFESSLKHFSLAWYKERPLLSGLNVHAGFSVIGGVRVPVVITTPLYSGVTVESPLRGAVGVGLRLALSLSRVISGGVVPIPLHRVIRLALNVPAPFSKSVRWGGLVPLPLREVVPSFIAVRYDLLERGKVLSPFWLGTPIIDMTPIIRTTLFTLEDPTGIDVDGIDIESASVVIDEGSSLWTGTFELTNKSDLSKFKAHSLFRFYIHGEEFLFLVSAKNLEHTGPSVIRPTLVGVSPALQLSAPMSLQVTKTWNTSVMAHDVILEMAGGYPVEITIGNWPILAYRLGVSNASPLDVIKTVAEAVGGVVDSKPDGTLRIRPKYPVSIPQWGPATVNHVYTPDGHVFTSKSQDLPVRVFNKFRVMDAQIGQGGDRLDYTEITSTTGEIRAYLSPWREAALVCTSYTADVLGVREEYRDEEETIEIFNGTGNVRYPVYGVNSIQWMGVPLGGIVAGNDSTVITSTSEDDKFSMLKISYKTRCLVYDVRGEFESVAQFLLEGT